MTNNDRTDANIATIISPKTNENISYGHEFIISCHTSLEQVNNKFRLSFLKENLFTFVKT
jgi:hypothetical protein